MGYETNLKKQKTKQICIAAGVEAEAVPLTCCNILVDCNLLDLWLACLRFTPDICCG